MGLIAWIVLGALAGWIASIIMGRNAQMGALANIIVGIIGAFLGAWIVSLLPGAQGNVMTFSIQGLLVAILGAVVLLFLVGLVRRS